MNKIIIANWKMNGNIAMVLEYINQVIDLPAIIALPDIYLALVQQLLMQHKSEHLIKLASQNISIYSNYGAYTAQISASMLQDVGVQYAIIGHSEIREHLHKMFTQCQNDDINYINFISEYLCKQLQNALDVGITPIFCIGESIEERLSGNYENFLLQQLSIIKKINNVKQIIIAYEPVWSIGTGITPTIQQILEITTMIRRFLTSCQLLTTSHVIYGGSVNSNNILEIIKNSSIDGVLIGGASLKWQNFTELVKLCS